MLGNIGMMLLHWFSWLFELWFVACIILIGWLMKRNYWHVARSSITSRPRPRLCNSTRVTLRNARSKCVDMRGWSISRRASFWLPPSFVYVWWCISCEISVRLMRLLATGYHLVDRTRGCVVLFQQVLFVTGLNSSPGSNIVYRRHPSGGFDCLWWWCCCCSLYRRFCLLAPIPFLYLLACFVPNYVL